jgi:hypothetical protein
MVPGTIMMFKRRRRRIATPHLPRIAVKRGYFTLAEDK